MQMSKVTSVIKIHLFDILTQYQSVFPSHKDNTPDQLDARVPLFPCALPCLRSRFFESVPCGYGGSRSAHGVSHSFHSEQAALWSHISEVRKVHL